MKLIIALIVTISILSALFISCSEDSVTINNNETVSRVNTTIAGTVLKEDGTPISGAQVTVEGRVKTSGSNGQFFFENVSVPSHRLYIKASLTGYFSASTSAKPNADAATLVQLRMMEKDNIQTISGAAGGTVSLTNGSSVQIQPNSLELLNGTPYTGTVNIAIEYLDPASQLFPLILPGGDLSAKRSDSSAAILFSYSMLAVELTGSGNEQLRIKPGQNSTLTASIPASMVSGAPATIPLWYFDDAAGTWREDGSAIKQGSSYVGSVTHFTDWSWCEPGNSALLKGRFIDCNNNGLPSACIVTGQGITFTNAQGYFERYVPTGIQFNVSVSTLYNYGLYSSPLYNVNPLAINQVFDMGNKQIDCPVQVSYIKGHVVCTGETPNTYIIMRNYSEISTITSDDGNFIFPGRPVTMYSMSIYKSSTSYTTGVYFPPVGTTYDLGDITLCNIPATIGDNGYIIDGDGFDNEIVGFSSPNTYGTYYNEDNRTAIGFGDYYDTTKIVSLGFIGSQAGTYPSNFFIIRLMGRDYHTDDLQPGEIIVDYYGPVGDYITGRFSGTLYNNYTHVAVDIMSGKFKVLRY